MNDAGGIFLSYYGDDFSGSTDVMESLTRAGMRTILFLEPPSREQLRRFRGIRAFGVAGLSRSMPTAQMDKDLAGVFAGLRKSGAAIVHYKVCSTFDSSPHTGSIGRAIDIGQSIFASPFVPLVVGVPVLGRYCVFGNLFARSGPESSVFRLDRHPTMRQHPVTPMDESDLQLHLSRQTPTAIGLMDVLQLSGAGEEIDIRLAALLESGPKTVLFDVLGEEHLRAIGRLIWLQAKRTPPLFVAGSSGIEYALTAYMGAARLLPSAPVFAGAAKVEQAVVISGSCSPVTERQIAWSLNQAHEGFCEITVDTMRLVDSGQAAAEIGAVAERALNAIAGGRSIIIHTGRGPGDARIEATLDRVRPSCAGNAEVKFQTGKMLGTALGRILRSVLEKTDIRRAAVAGGDTSGHVAREIGIEALEMIAPLAPGGPLCRAYAGKAGASGVEGLEIVFKGGQVGKEDFFDSLLAGSP
ncbi:MAG: four-carbon acid sugar kinase family protein [Terriglobia bacterium]